MAEVQPSTVPSVTAQVAETDPEGAIRVANEIAQQAIQPALQATALQASRQNFVMIAQRRGSDGRPVVSPEALAREWAKDHFRSVISPEALAREWAKDHFRQ